jgi:hypothetical protein
MKIDVPLKRPEFKRDEMGRFEQRGAELIKKPKKTSKHVVERRGDRFGGPGPGRPPGSLNKTTLKLREAILAALDQVGGVDYLAKLAIENSSAFSSLLSKVLPTQLASDADSNGGSAQVVFTRVIVRPGEAKTIDGECYPTTNLPEPDTKRIETRA